MKDRYIVLAGDNGQFGVTTIDLRNKKGDSIYAEESKKVTPGMELRYVAMNTSDFLAFCSKSVAQFVADSICGVVAIPKALE